MMQANPETSEAFVSAVLDAALIHQTGGDWKALMRRHKNRYKIGAARKLFETIFNYSTEDMEVLAEAISREASK